MKNIYIIVILLSSFFISAQVGLNTEKPRVTLDIMAKRAVDGTIVDHNQYYGLQPPRVTLQELTNNTFVYGNDQAGALIYITDVSGGTKVGQRINITDEGIYYFTGTVWKKMISVENTRLDVASTIDPNILGYTPSSVATAATAGVPVISGRVVTKLGTITYNENGHSYAGYVANGLIDWFQAYEAAKSLGGYLVTFTTDDEWKFVETNLISKESAFVSYSGWIGFAKFSWSAGAGLVPNPEMKWITGEQPQHKYNAVTNLPVLKTQWFKTGEPNNSGGNEGFVHFYKGSSNERLTIDGYTSTHPWNDLASDYTSVELIRGFIVEFQQ